MTNLTNLLYTNDFEYVQSDDIYEAQPDNDDTLTIYDKFKEAIEDITGTDEQIENITFVRNDQIKGYIQNFYIDTETLPRIEDIDRILCFAIDWDVVVNEWKVEGDITYITIEDVDYYYMTAYLQY